MIQCSRVQVRQYKYYKYQIKNLSDYTNLSRKIEKVDLRLFQKNVRFSYDIDNQD